MQIPGFTAERGHQHPRRLPAGAGRGRRHPNPRGADGGHCGLRPRPLLRPLRQGRGVLHSLGLHPAHRGRHHSHRQAFPAAGPESGTEAEALTAPRACSHKPHVRIFEQILAECEAKICRRTGVRQKFLTKQAAKFAEKTCARAYVNRP